MSISAYSGLSGSGKSYGVFENVIIPALEEGRAVYTNIPFNHEELMDYCGFLPVPFESRDIQDNPNWFQEVFEPGSIFVCDEAWRIWQGGTKANQIPDGHKSFFAEHRHMVGDNGKSTEIILCTQDLAQIATYVRNLIETTYRSVKLAAIGAEKRFRIDVFPGPVTGPNPPKNQRIREIYGTYKPEIYALYKSHTMSQTGEAGDETKADKRANIFKSYIFKMFPILAIACLAVVWFGYTTVAEFFGADDAPLVPNSSEVQTNADTSHRSTAAVNRPEQIDHLRGRDLTIVSNNGRSPAEYAYVIEAKKGDSWYRLTKSELLKLGYTLKPINQCFAVIEMGKASYAVTCRTREDKSIVDFNFQAGGRDQDGA